MKRIPVNRILAGLTLLLLLIAVSIVVLVSYGSMPVSGEVGFDYVSPMMPAVDMGELKRYIDDLVSFGSRFTGYPGCYRAADYIESKFKEFGLQDIGRHSFIVRMERTTGPRGSWITFGREFIDLMRKQVLLWRDMKTAERAEYQRRFKSIKEKISQA